MQHDTIRRRPCVVFGARLTKAPKESGCCVRPSTPRARAALPQ